MELNPSELLVNTYSSIFDNRSLTFSYELSKITRECSVCSINRPEYEYQGKYSDGCFHIQRTVCDTCIYEYIKYLVENTIIYDEQIKCPEQNCQGIFNFHTIRDILLSTGKDHFIFEQYDQHLIHQRLEQMTEFVWCAHECGSGQLHDLQSSSTPEIICIKCKQRTCFKHRTIWHTGLTCDDYDILRNEIPDDDSQKWIKDNTKRCPQCQWYIEKNAGCDQMKCRRCQHKFCWQCLVDQRIISAYGKSKHQPTCTHYKPERVNTNEQHQTHRWCAVQ